MNVEEMFAQIELDLLASMTKSMQSGDWREQRMTAFKQFQQRNVDILNKHDIPAGVQDELRQAYLTAGKRASEQAEKRLPPSRHTGVSFSVNDDKLVRMVQDITRDLTNAKVSAFRLMDDIYRQTQLKAQLAMSTNLYTLNQAIDIASKDFLAAGINSIRYANGNRVNIVSYAEMCLRSGNRRAGLQAEGAARADWGVYTVWVSQYGACSDTCLPWQGRVYFDDVYSGGSPSRNTGNYLLLSEAMAGGLFHPNCRHKSSTWYPDFSAAPKRMDEAKIHEASSLEGQQRYNERQIRKWKRLEQGSLDPQNKLKYKNKVQEWQARQRELIEAHPEILRRDYSREKVSGSRSIPQTPVRESAVPKTLEVPTEKNKAAVKEYMTGSYNGINSRLRTGSAINAEFVDDLIVNIDEFIDKSPRMSEEIVVHRGTRIEELGFDGKINEASARSLERTLKRDGLSNKGYLSTSTETLDTYNNGVVMNITVPKGAKAVDVSDLSGVAWEKEVLLARDSVLDVESVVYDKKKRAFVVNARYRV